VRSHVWPSANTTSLAGEIVHSARCRPRLSHVVADKVCGRPDERALVAQRRLALLPVWQLQQRVVPGGGVVLRARAQARAGSRLIWRPEISAAVPCSSSHLKSSSQLGCAAADTGDAEAAPFCAARRAGPWSKLPCDSGAHARRCSCKRRCRSASRAPARATLASCRSLCAFPGTSSVAVLRTARVSTLDPMFTVLPCLQCRCASRDA